MTNMNLTDEAVAQKMPRSERSKHHDEVRRLTTMITQISEQRDQASANFAEANRRLVVNTPAPPFSDCTIADRYRSICGLTEDWVDRNCGSMEDFVARLNENEWCPPERALVDDLLDRGKVLEIGQSHAEAGTYVVMRIMMRFLFEKLLKRQRWLPGLTTEQEKLLNILLYHMYDACPARDAQWREGWRCDTYTSIKMSKEVPEARAKFLSDCLSQLLSLLTTFVDDREHIDTSRLEKILKDTADLADAIRSCPVPYNLIHQFAPQMPKEGRRLDSKILENYDIIDADKGTSIRSIDTIGSGRDKCRGQILCTIFPSLMKTTPDGKVFRLAKGLLLAKIECHDEQDQTRSDVVETSKQGGKTIDSFEHSDRSLVKPVQMSWVDAAKR